MKSISVFVSWIFTRSDPAKWGKPRGCLKSLSGKGKERSLNNAREKVEHGGAANTKSYLPDLISSKISACLAADSKSCESPPRRMSRLLMSRDIAEPVLAFRAVMALSSASPKSASLSAPAKR